MFSFSHAVLRRARHAYRNPLFIAAAALGALALWAATHIAAQPTAAPACTIEWDRGGGTDSWHLAANWNEVGTGTDRLPGTADHVCLNDQAGSSVTHDTGTTAIASIQDAAGADEKLVLSAGRLNVNSTTDPSQVGELEHTGGDLGGTAVVSVGDYTWTGGGQDTPNEPFNQPGLGQTVVTGSLLIDRPASQVGNPDPNAHNPEKAISRVLRVEGTATHRGNNGTSGNLGRLHIQGITGRLDIASGATYTLEDNQDIVSGGRGVDNDGTLVKPTGAGGDSLVSTPIDNDGTVQVREGRLLVQGAGGSHTGAWDIDGGATLHFNGGSGHVLTGAQGIRDTGAGSGETTVGFSGAVVVMQAPNGADNTLISAGRVDFNTNQTLPEVDQTDGSLGGTGTVTVGTYSWRGSGHQDTPNGANSTPGSGQTVVTGSLLIDRPASQVSNTDPNSHNPDKFLGRVLRVEGTATHRGNNGTSSHLGRLVIFGSSGRLDVASGATYSLEVNQDIVSSGRGVEVDGTLTKAVGASGDSSISTPLDQDGTLAVDQGSLSISGNGVDSHTGTFDVAGGGALRWNGGTHTVASASGIRRTPGDASAATTSGSFGGSVVTFDAPYNLDATSVSGGHAVFNGATSTGPLTLSGGRADFNTAITPPSVDQTDGTLGGTATVTTPTYSWRGSGHQDTPNGANSTPGSGQTVVTGSLTVDRPANQVGNTDPNAHNPDKFLNRVLRVEGTANHRGNNGTSSHLGRLLIFGNSGRLDISSGASYTLEDNQDIAGGGRGVDNQGTLTKSGASGDSAISTPFDQDGTLTIGQGNVVISGQGIGTHTGTFDVAGGSALRWNGGTHTVSSTDGVRRTPGDTAPANTAGSFGGSVVTFDAPYNLDATSVSGGQAVFNGATSTGPLTLSGGRADFNTAITPPSVDQTDGTLGGTATVTTPTYSWRGSGQQDTPNEPFNQPGLGQTVVTGSLTLDRPANQVGNTDPNSHNPDKFLNRVLRVEGAATHRGNNGTVGHLGRLQVFGLSGRLDIAPGASYTLEDNQDIAGAGRGVDNQGTLRKPSGSGTGESLIVPSLTQAGTLDVQTGSIRTANLASYNSTTDTLGGGRYVVAGTLAIAGGEIAVNAARLELDGSSAQVDNSSTTAPNDGLTGFATNAGTGDLRVLGGKSLTTPSSGGPFSNDGTVTVGQGSTLTATGGFSNNGTGTLRGDGTVGPSVTNAGTVRPGTSPGILTVAGDYTQTSAGELVVDVAGATPGTQLDQLAVSGAASLDGTLDLDPTVAPAASPTEYPILTHASRTGEFATIEDADITFDTRFRAVYDEQDSTPLVVASDDPPDIAIEQAETISEGDSGQQAAELTVSLSEPANQVVSVDYASTDGTARSPGDYADANGTLTFDPGQVAKTIAVPVNGDELDETDETVDVTLSAPTGGGLPSDATGTVTITDDDATPALSIRDEVLVEEGDTGAVMATVPVRLSAPSGRTVTVDYTTVERGTDPDDAQQGDDYTHTTGTLTFNEGDSTTQQIEVPVKGDTLDEVKESFDVTLSNPAAATLDPSVATSVVGIVDNDPAGGVVATPAASIEDVRVAEGDSGTSNARFAITLSEATTVPVTVSYATSGDGSATAPDDYTARTATPVVFDPGERTKVVDVPVNGDTQDEPDETFSVVLSAPTNATLALDGVDGTTATDATGTIVDDDPAPTPPNNPTVSIGDERVAEGDSGTSNARFVVRLSEAPTAPVRVSYATSDGTATQPGDYAARSGTVDFDAGERTQVIDVPVSGDTADEADETFSVALSSPSNATLGNTRATATVVDDDEPPRNDPAPRPQPQPQPQPQTPSEVVTPEDLAVTFTRTRPRTFGFNVVGVPLTCPAIAVNNCQGVLRLQVPAKRGKPGKIVGRAQFFVRANRSRIVSVRLYGSGQKLLRKKKKLVVDTTAVMRDQTKVTKRLKFKAPKNKKKKR